MNKTLLIAGIIVFLSCSGPGGRNEALINTPTTQYENPDRGKENGSADTLSKNSTSSQAVDSVRSQDKKDSIDKEESSGNALSQKGVTKYGEEIPEEVSEAGARGLPQWMLILAILIEGGAIGILYHRQEKSNKDFDKWIKEWKKEINGLKTDINIPYTLGSLEVDGRPKNQPVNPPKPVDQQPVKPEKSSNTDELQKMQKQRQPEPDLIYELVLYERGYLKPTEKQYAFYEVMHRPGEKQGTFGFKGNVKEAICSREAILDGPCEAEGRSSDVQDIETISNGSCELQDNGYWKVLKKARIKFKQ